MLGKPTQMSPIRAADPNATETRLYAVAEMVSLAVFPDTETDLSHHPKASNRRTDAGG